MPHPNFSKLICVRKHLSFCCKIDVPSNLSSKPSKCPKFYTHTISGEKRIHAKKLFFFPTETSTNCRNFLIYSKLHFFDKMPKKQPVNSPINLLNYFWPSYPGTFTKLVDKNATKKRITKKTPYVKSNTFTQKCMFCKCRIQKLKLCADS